MSEGPISAGAVLAVTMSAAVLASKSNRLPARLPPLQASPAKPLPQPSTAPLANSLRSRKPKSSVRETSGPAANGVDDQGNAVPSWGWDWCAVFPPEAPATALVSVYQRREFVKLCRKCELSTKTIKRHSGYGRTFVLIGCREGRMKEEADRLKLRMRQSSR